ncbi:Hypothetical protein R9X50_00523100 [Acrodontium crateriforme]|uniref:MADS-box domain-containing protein n=1 Tax=Acrodontium crateriforme TaxID=150365 RepID=A0AAQ3RD54_9PEZI|nr:Hypothetical protein R9X50_00523100 [Acrodontium crateriforme]
MGRRKIEIKPIRDDRNRSVTFLKRKGGLFKKAHELSVLCSVDVAVVIFGHNKKLYEYSSSDINEILGRFQYYGGAHEHKGPADFADKAGGDDDDDDDGGEELDDSRRTPVPEHAMMHHPPPPHMQTHPGYQHLVRSGTPSGSPPIPNGAMPQFQRGPSPLPPGVSRPSSRTSQHPGHIRRPSSNLAQGQMQGYTQGQPPPPPHAYPPNQSLYNPQGPPPGPRPVQQGHQATYPPPYPSASYGQPPLTHQQQVQQAFLQDNRRSSMPPNFPPQPNTQPGQSAEHLQPPPQRPPHGSPNLQQQQRATPSPQPPQQSFASPPMPQPRALPAHAKSHNIFTPIDDSRSMLAQHWGSTSDTSRDPPRIDGSVKFEGGSRPQSIDVASVQRSKTTPSKLNGSPPPPAARPLPRSPLANQRSASSPRMPTVKPPTRANASQSDAKRPRLKVQIPSEQSGDEAATASAAEETATGRGPVTGSQQQHHPQPSHGVVLPPPSPSAGALLSAGASGPPNPFARPAPPMSSNPHAINRDVPNRDISTRDSNHIETPISALPSRFLSDNLLPSPSTFYPEWGFGRGDSNTLPSPLNFQTPVVGNGQGWSRSGEESERKRGISEDDAAGSEAKRRKD